MSAFKDLIASTGRKPDIVVDFPTNGWADEYEERARDVVVMGLRRLPQREIDTARAEAARHAWQMHPVRDDEDARIECYNDALIRWAIGRALCRPDDAHLPWFEGGQEDVVAEAFNVHGLRYIWHHLEFLSAQHSPSVREATDEDVQRLAKRVADGGISSLGRKSQGLVRRYIGAALDELER